MKIAHLSVSRQFTSGQAKQLRFEYDAAQSLEYAEWTTVAYHNGPLTEPYMRRIPALFNALFMRNLWGWIVALRLSRTHDIVMMRHMTFDPFAFIFAPLIPNRISVHHAKEIEELRLIRKDWKGWAASCLERYSGRFAVRWTRMIFGVTQEIAEYERDIHAPGKPICVYANGVNVAQIVVLEDKRRPDQIHVAFICGTFSEWHGLDKLIAAVDAHAPQINELPLTIHLIGKLSNAQVLEIAGTAARRKAFLAHGALDEPAYRGILEKCDLGIASLAMERKNLREGSTLKVREMLALGLAIYSGHGDSALNEAEKFIAITSNPSILDIVGFAFETKVIGRDFVRSKSFERIEKSEAMRKCIRILSSIS